MARIKTIAGHPVEQHDSPNGGGKMSDHRGPVLHIAEGSYRGTIAWQMNPDQRYASGGTVTTCSTWIVGKNRGEIAQMKDTDYIAWCQRSGSRTRTSIELEGYAPGAPTEWQIEAAAHILADEHRRYGVPLKVANDDTQDGLGHHSMDREWANVEWGHDSCPGTGVINAKAAMVRRAQAIVAGEDDDMSFFTEKNPQTGRTGEQMVVDLWWANFKGNNLDIEQAALKRVEASLAAIAADPGNNVTFGPDQVAQLAGLLAPLLPTAEQIAAAVAGREASADRARADALTAEPS